MGVASLSEHCEKEKGIITGYFTNANCKLRVVINKCQAQGVTDSIELYCIFYNIETSFSA